MKCTKCGGRAVVDLKRHNSGFCKEHFIEYFQRQVKRAVSEFGMVARNDRVLVAVSGGKDSLVLWDVLLRFGYQADGLYVGLGIGGYSPASAEKAEAFAAGRGAVLRRVSLSERYGYDIPQASKRLRRAACSPCGLSKRYVFNREALEGGYDVVATGHNLDDEAAVLFGNVIRWQSGYLGRQYPVLEERGGGRLIKKVKPLIRLTERETAAYAVLNGIDYMVEECPKAVGARSHVYKDLLNQLELKSPGSKQQFLYGFFERGRPAFEEEREVELTPCPECGQPTSREGACAFCNMARRLRPAG